MKTWSVLFSLVCFVGCSVADPVQNIIRDKQFEQYMESLEQVEAKYLQKSISYAQYLEMKKMIEDEYQAQIDGRREMIQGRDGSRLERVDAP